MNGRVPGIASEVQAPPYPSSGHLSGYSIATNGSRLQAFSIERRGDSVVSHLAA